MGFIYLKNVFTDYPVPGTARGAGDTCVPAIKELALDEHMNVLFCGNLGFVSKSSWEFGTVLGASPSCDLKKRGCVGE